ncbi:versican core protein-like [Sycon ciliatum]|uniref:versican core protein-like n=1 Tax=Sycon ciliatum TaxID=27933 RepID=UPI0031F702DC
MKHQTSLSLAVYLQLALSVSLALSRGLNHEAGCLSSAFQAVGIDPQRASRTEQAFAYLRIQVQDISQSLLTATGTLSVTERNAIHTCLNAGSQASQCNGHEICSGNGQCVLQSGRYACQCSSPSYTGQHCQTEVGYCASNPCLNGATCVNGDTKAVCRCRVGYSGDRCEELWLSKQNFYTPWETYKMEMNAKIDSLTQLVQKAISSVGGQLSTTPTPTPTPRRERRYELFRTRTSWDAANANCEADGGSLPVVRNSTELAAVMAVSDARAGGRIWLSGEDRDADGVWHWTNGDRITFQNWNQGEPNGRGRENCLLLVLFTDRGPDPVGQFNDAICNSYAYSDKFVCQYD